MKRVPLIVFLCVVCAFAGVSASALSADFSPLLTLRFGNLDAIDAEDGDLAVFLKSIRNDGRFIPPMRTIVGPEIRNPTFFGVTYEAWVECVVLAPEAPGGLERVWVFPVDNRDEYLTQLINQGLNEYEDMDEVSVLREIDPDGNAHTWYLEWLPGNIAVFGAERESVTAARRVYEENSAAAGLLAPPGGRLVEPDLTARLAPPRLAMWQDAEPGTYWWREQANRLVGDLVRYWKPNPARERLVRSLAEEFILWPRGVESLELNVWFEPDGIEFRLRAAGDFGGSPKSGLNILRSLPDRTAAACAAAVTPQTFDAFARSAGALALGAAGGVVSQEARAAVDSMHSRLRAAGMREAAWAWIAPPAEQPELGGARMLVADWENPEELERAWAEFEAALRPDTAFSRALSQLGWDASLRRGGAGAWADPRTAEIVLMPAGENGVAPLYAALFACRRNGNRLALVVGASKPDEAERGKIAAYRAALAEECVNRTDDGTPDARSAFTRVDASGAGMAALFSPVRFLQLALVEAADWQPRSADQNEPLSTRFAREMLEYGAGDAWTAAGVGTERLRDVNGGLSWKSLSRLCAALGITESIGMD